MRVLGIIFAGGRAESLGLLTTKRASAAVPIAGKYRGIDFTLSNMVSSGISRVGVLTQYNPRSLTDHLGSGKEWDLDRKQGGLFLLQPYVDIENLFWYRGTADSLRQNITFLKRSVEDYVLIGSGDHIYSCDYSKIFQFHKERDAHITVLYKDMDESYNMTDYGVIDIDENDRVIRFEEKPEKPFSRKGSLGVYFINKHLLIDLLYDNVLEKNGYKLLDDVFLGNFKRLKFYAYKFNGYWRNLKKGVSEYYRINMDFLKNDIRKEIFDSEVRVHTKLKDLPPPKATRAACIKNSIISDGSVISGKVINSILSRGVNVKAGAIVENSILLQDTTVKEGSHVKYSIFDKGCLIRSEKKLIGKEDDILVFDKGSVI